ncbi:hypothetical protein B296_00021434 [Ensete ventricosum]|uniref:Uncharacterized protein n=1 Tax=Ensete ventricosum TaxID=4639 RepID=A0A427AWG8_ENSVE|nr:hypothetical protein B296_00021434 [Ensete ventricosum]
MISELLNLTVSFLYAWVILDISPWAPAHVPCGAILPSSERNPIRDIRRPRSTPVAAPIDEGKAVRARDKTEATGKRSSRRKGNPPSSRSIPSSLHESSRRGVVRFIRSRDGLRELRPIPDSSGYSFLASCLFPLEFAQIGGSWILSWSL